jgi:hypothetical protein
MATRKQNQRKFPNWQELENGGRRYWYDVLRDDGFVIRYVKIVDADEVTTGIIQELYDAFGKLVSIHEKYPIDRGHRYV